MAIQDFHGLKKSRALRSAVAQSALLAVAVVVLSGCQSTNGNEAAEFGASQAPTSDDSVAATSSPAPVGETLKPDPVKACPVSTEEIQLALSDWVLPGSVTEDFSEVYDDGSTYCSFLMEATPEALSGSGGVTVNGVLGGVSIEIAGYSYASNELLTLYHATTESRIGGTDPRSVIDSALAAERISISEQSPESTVNVLPLGAGAFVSHSGTGFTVAAEGPLWFRGSLGGLRGNISLIPSLENLLQAIAE